MNSRTLIALHPPSFTAQLPVSGRCDRGLRPRRHKRARSREIALAGYGERVDRRWRACPGTASNLPPTRLPSTTRPWVPGCDVSGWWDLNPFCSRRRPANFTARQRLLRTHTYVPFCAPRDGDSLRVLCARSVLGRRARDEAIVARLRRSPFECVEVPRTIDASELMFAAIDEGCR
jgi:hypothetical protein